MTISKSQMDKLGKRIRENPNDHDLRILLREVRATYGLPLQETEDRLRLMGLRPTSRIKTETTIIEKLARERTRLSSMQDIGGLRVITTGTLNDQDAVAAEIETSFAGTKRYDRRLTPSAGYRAVHLVVRVQDLPIEIQIRTEMQDLWAQVMERVADRWGREIRYGIKPGQRFLRSFVRDLRKVSDTIYRLEKSKCEALGATNGRGRIRAFFLKRRARRDDELEGRVKSMLEEILSDLEHSELRAK